MDCAVKEFMVPSIAVRTPVCKLAIMLWLKANVSSMIVFVAVSRIRNSRPDADAVSGSMSTLASESSIGISDPEVVHQSD